MVDSLGGHVVQGRAWAQFHEAQGNNVLWAAGAATGARWCWLGIIRSRRGFRDLYLPYGPAFDGTANFDEALTSALDAARSNGIDMVRIEPWGGVDADHLRSRGAVPTRQIQPQHTWLIDLRQTEEELFKGCNTNRRRDIRTAAKNGLKIWRTENPDDIGTFISLLGATAERGHFNVHSDGYYRTLAQTLMPRGAASLYFAGMDAADPIAGILGLHTRFAAYYAHAAADQERSREHNVPGPLAWRMILDAKRAGCVRYDFWGVTRDESPDHPWAGLSRFKRGFGGTMHSTAGTWDVPISGAKYLVYRAARRVAG